MARGCSRRTIATAAPTGCWRPCTRRASWRSDFVDQARRRSPAVRRSPPNRSWCGSRRRAIRCCGSSTFARSPRRPTRWARWSSSDNTFLSPLWQQPLALGADLVMHSTTKYLNGHSDVVGGAVIAATPELTESIAWWANAIGVTGAPFDSFLSLRGVRTLHARMRVHAENTAAVVELLSRHPAVQQVFYPGLADHPGHELARRQQSGFGAMLSFELAGGETGGGGVSRRTRMLYARRITRRRREFDRSSRQHDACGHGGIGAAAGRDRRWDCCACRSASRMPRIWSRTSAPVSSARRAPDGRGGGAAKAQPEPHRRRHAS